MAICRPCMTRRCHLLYARLGLAAGWRRRSGQTLTLTKFVLGPRPMINLYFLAGAANALTPPAVIVRRSYHMGFTAACYLLLNSLAGAANAGVPLAMIVQRFGWDAFFIAMTASCAVVLLLMAPMTNLKSYSQREAEGLVKAA